MLRLDLERELPCSPTRAWPLISEPALMNLWSSARIEPVSAGDGGHPGGTGAIRRVHLPSRPRRTLIEIVERADAPRRLDYRVIGGAPIRHHAGALHLLEAAGATLLRWEIEIDFVAPGVAWVAGRTIRPALERSLARLAELAGAPPSGLPPPPTRALDDSPEALIALRDEADRIAAAQRALADRLLHLGDDRGHFARAMQLVTEDLGAMLDNDRFDHPGWILRLIPLVHRAFDDNLARRMGARAGEVEPHWARAFDDTEGARRRGAGPFDAALTGIVAGLRAHVEDDLPRALADTFRPYAGRCDYARFLPDYLRTTGLLGDAGARVLAEWPRHAWSRRARWADALTPRTRRAAFFDRAYFPITRAHRIAFDRGAALVGR